MQDENERSLLRKIAQLYYHQSFTQSEIAARCGLSRPKVSRLLAEAKETGIVKIFIEDDLDAMDELEERILQKYCLKAVKVVSVPKEDRSLAERITAREAAVFMANFLEHGDTIGISWGYTIYSIVKAFPELSLKGSQIVQLSGNLDSVNKASRADEIVKIMSQKLGAEAAYTFPCPAMVDNAIILDTILHDKKIGMVMEKARNCDKAIVNLAAMGENDCLYKGGYVGAREIRRLQAQGAAGRICCRYINAEGALCDADIDRRTMGVSLAALREKRFVMTCVTAESKLPVLAAALKGGYVNVLALDAICAAKLLAL